MELRILIITSLFFAPLAWADTVYKTVDEQGNIVFSDKSTAGAEEIKIKAAQTIDIPDAKLPEYKSVEEEESGLQYTKLLITSPENDSTVHSNEGNVNINIEIEPALNENDSIVLFMDGKQVAIGKTAFSLANVDRGTHTISAEVKNENNESLLRSAELVFHIRRIAQLSPDFIPDPKVESPLNPPRPKQAEVSPTNPPKPKTVVPQPASSPVP